MQQHLIIDDLFQADYLVQRHLHPTPRISQGLALRDVASTAIHLSDGLISDLGHILKAMSLRCADRSGYAAYSSVLCNHVEPEHALRWALAGGEDYELCFTVPECHCDALDAMLVNADVPVTCIGRVTADQKRYTFSAMGSG